MKTHLRTLLFLLLLVSIGGGQDFAAQDTLITPADAIEYIGEVKAVVGEVASTRYVYWLRGQPTYFNLDIPYPKQIFTVVIWGVDRPKFGMPPEDRFKGKRICVTGLIEKSGDLPQIVVSSPSQIEILPPVSEQKQ